MDMPEQNSDPPEAKAIAVCSICEEDIYGSNVNDLLHCQICSKVLCGTVGCQKRCPDTGEMVCKDCAYTNEVFRDLFFSGVDSAINYIYELEGFKEKYQAMKKKQQETVSEGLRKSDSSFIALLHELDGLWGAVQILTNIGNTTKINTKLDKLHEAAEKAKISGSHKDFNVYLKMRISMTE